MVNIDIAYADIGIATSLLLKKRRPLVNIKLPHSKKTVCYSVRSMLPNYKRDPHLSTQSLDTYLHEVMATKPGLAKQNSSKLPQVLAESKVQDPISVTCQMTNSKNGWLKLPTRIQISMKPTLKGNQISTRISFFFEDMEESQHIFKCLVLFVMSSSSIYFLSHGQA